MKTTVLSASSQPSSSSQASSSAMPSAPIDKTVLGTVFNGYPCIGRFLLRRGIQELLPATAIITQLESEGAKITSYLFSEELLRLAVLSGDREIVTTVWKKINDLIKNMEDKE